MMGSVEEIVVNQEGKVMRGVPKNLDILESCITCQCPSSTGILSFG